MLAVSPELYSRYKNIRSFGVSYWCLPRSLKMDWVILSLSFGRPRDLRQLFNDARSDGLCCVMRGKINDRAADIVFLLIDRRDAVSFASR